MTLDDFFPFVLPHVKNCPNEVARHHIRQALVELCDRALVWREYQSAVTTVADQSAYAWAPAVDQQVMKLLSAKMDGLDLDVIDPTMSKANKRNEASITGALNGFELSPLPAAGRLVVTYCAVAPTQRAETIPDGFGAFAEQIGRGARGSIMLIPDEAFTDEQKGSGWRSKFEGTDIPLAREKAFRGFGRSRPRNYAAWF